jgi:hypothetical protein
MSPWLQILSHLLNVKRSAVIQQVLLVICHNIPFNSVPSPLTENITKNMTSWVVSLWRCGEDQLAQGEGSKPFQIAQFTWESQPHKSNSGFNSSPICNLGEVDLKADSQVAYNVQSGHSWTCWKDKEIIFPMGLVSYTSKI